MANDYLKIIEVINEKPNATKKGLRMQIDSVKVDEKGNVIEMVVKYSDYRICGIAIVNVTPFYIKG